MRGDGNLSLSLSGWTKVDVIVRYLLFCCALLDRATAIIIIRNQRKTISLINVYFNSFLFFFAQEDQVAERTQPHPAVWSVRPDYEKLGNGHVSFTKRFLRMLSSSGSFRRASVRVLINFKNDNFCSCKLPSTRFLLRDFPAWEICGQIQGGKCHRHRLFDWERTIKKRIVAQ